MNANDIAGFITWTAMGLCIAYNVPSVWKQENDDYGILSPRAFSSLMALAAAGFIFGGIYCFSRLLGASM